MAGTEDVQIPLSTENGVKKNAISVAFVLPAMRLIANCGELNNFHGTVLKLFKERVLPAAVAHRSHLEQQQTAAK